MEYSRQVHGSTRNFSFPFWNIFIYSEHDERHFMKDEKSTIKATGSKPNRHILVKFKDADNNDHIKQHITNKLALKTLETKKKLKYSKTEILNIHDDDDLDLAVSELHNHPDVDYAQVDFKLHACTTNSLELNSSQWAICNSGQPDSFGNEGTAGVDVNVVNAWDITKGSSDVLIAVIDTGIDINHVDLRANIYRSPSENPQNSSDDDNNRYIDDITGWDFANKDNTVFDSASEDKHGTEVAGIIAGEGIATGVIGVAPGVKILPLKFMSNNHGNTSSAIEAIEYARTKGVRIANCSWGDYKDNPALKHHMENSDMLFICAAGNDGNDLSEKPFYPACFDLPNVISVAAINNRGSLWPLSNYGGSIDIAAPGSSILSTVPSQGDVNYGYDSGTSLATPHVTGVAALLLSVNKNMSPAELKEQILKNATVLKSLDGKVRTGGIVNAYKTITSK